MHGILSAFIYYRIKFVLSQAYRKKNIYNTKFILTIKYILIVHMLDSIIVVISLYRLDQS